MTYLSTALRDMLNSRVSERGIAGLSVATENQTKTQTIWVPEATNKEPGFLAYSLTKVFIAALVLLVREEGKVDIDASLTRWFPNFEESSQISPRQLLNHTSGIPDYGELQAYHDAVRSEPGEPWTLERFAAETIEKGLAFSPGMSWAYSNPGYMLLKQIIEKATGQSFAALVSSRISEPLGLRRTFVAETTRDLSSLACAPSGVLSLDGRPLDTREIYHPGWVSHGVVASTPSEITHFLAALFSDRVVSSSSLREMTTLVRVPNAPPHWREPSYGLGVMADPASSWGALFGHGGAGPGYSASAFHAADLGGRTVTVCAMCALENDSTAEQLALAALELVRRSKERAV